MKLIRWLAMTCLLAVSAHALDSNEKINYQGRLINGTNLFNGIATNVFRLYSSSGGTTVLFAQTQVVTVVDGLYSTTIGSDTITPSLQSALASAAVYIEVEVNGAVLSPRERIFQAPYSLSDVDKTGDTMTGALRINDGAGSNLVITSAGSAVAIGNGADPGTSGTAVGNLANGSLFGSAFGADAVADNHGAALGDTANGSAFGAAVGEEAEGTNVGAAMGNLANGIDHGAAMGASSYGYDYGAAVGFNAAGFQSGAGVGNAANGFDRGAAMGPSAYGYYGGVAVGAYSRGIASNVAVGLMANAGNGGNRIAIGNRVTNNINDSAAIRGTLYLDGGTGIYYRASFGAGNWTNYPDYVLVSVVTNLLLQRSGGTVTNVIWETTTIKALK